jgi:catalase
VPRLTDVLAHARGVLLTGTFTPSEDAKTLSSAPQFNSPSTPITVRFSSSTGIPQIPDTDPNANPRGIAIRFNLGGRKHTDIVSHSTPFFPVRTGQEFLDFLGAITGGTIGDYLGAHPKALAFVQAPKPSPESFATEPYFGVTALKFINAEGKTTYFRYQIIPEAGIKTLDEESLKEKGPNYLFEELPKRIAEGPASYKLLAQIAEEGDTTDDATVHWPEDRKLVELGTVKLEAMMPESEKEQKHMIFDPIPRVQGIEPSDDPLLELRAAVYLLSGRERRAA